MFVAKRAGNENMTESSFLESIGTIKAMLPAVFLVPPVNCWFRRPPVFGVPAKAYPTELVVDSLFVLEEDEGDEGDKVGVFTMVSNG